MLSSETSIFHMNSELFIFYAPHVIFIYTKFHLSFWQFSLIRYFKKCLKIDIQCLDVQAAVSPRSLLSFRSTFKSNRLNKWKELFSFFYFFFLLDSQGTNIFRLSLSHHCSLSSGSLFWFGLVWLGLVWFDLIWFE